MPYARVVAIKHWCAVVISRGQLELMYSLFMCTGNARVFSILHIIQVHLLVTERKKSNQKKD